MAAELSPFNIQVLTVQPEMPTHPNAHKVAITDCVRQAIAKLDSTAVQAPSKTAEAIVEELLQLSSDSPLLRMTLGEESLGGIRKIVEE